MELQQRPIFLTQPIDHALTSERMADAEPNKSLKAFERQAVAYRRLRRKSRQKGRLAAA
jgi:hypothetical protein